MLQKKKPPTLSLKIKISNTWLNKMKIKMSKMKLKILKNQQSKKFKISKLLILLVLNLSQPQMLAI